METTTENHNLSNAELWSPGPMYTQNSCTQGTLQKRGRETVGARGSLIVLPGSVRGDTDESHQHKLNKDNNTVVCIHANVDVGRETRGFNLTRAAAGN